MLRIMTLIAALLSPFGAGASSYVPADDREILERLPEGGDPWLRVLKRTHAALRARPDDASLAATFSRRAIEASRSTGDPRYLGQARAALAPWWRSDDVPPSLLLLRATVRQSLHDFDGALSDLDRLLAGAPNDAQARLTRATVRNVVGRHAEALADCEAIAGRVATLVATACRADAIGRAGRAREAYQVLAGALGRERGDDGVRAWAATIAAETAARLGEHEGAERHFRLALAVDPMDRYAIGAYADWLLDAGRPREAATLVAPHTRHDALLLRCVLALQASDDGTLAARRAELAERVAAARRRGDGIHRREEARHALAVEHDARRAVAIARENWSVQREPADVRILVEAAQAAGDDATLRSAAAWMKMTRLEDVRIAAILEGATR